MSKTILHSFQEEKVSGMKDHLRNWFGITLGDNEDVVCYCGAELVTIGFDEDSNEISACWHLKRYGKEITA